MSVRKKLEAVVAKNIWFHIFSFTAVMLIVTSFFIPPLAQIDSSVFVGVGELFAFGALWVVAHALEKGYDAQVTHGNTTISIGDKNTDNEQQ